MPYTFADSVLDGFDDLIRGLRGWTKADHTQYFPIVSAHNKNALAAFNGSLISVIEIEGYMGQFIPDHFIDLRKEWVAFFRTNAGDKSAKGFDIFWSYEFDPEGMRDYMAEWRKPMKAAADRRGMAIGDILDEEVELYAARCAQEKQFIILVTHLDSLQKAEQKPAKEEAYKRRLQTLKGRGAMLMNVGIPALDVVHEQHVAKVMLFLASVQYGYAARRLDVYEALTEMRKAFIPSSSKGWKPRLTLRDCKFRSTEEVPQSISRKECGGPKDDLTFILPPKLSRQMVPDGVVDLGRYVVVGDRTYAPLFVDELASDPQPLEHLLRGLYRHRLPMRMVYSLMANSEQANYWNRLFAGTFNFMSASNRQITAATRAMKAYQETQNGALFGYGISVTTWAPTEVQYDDTGRAMYRVKGIEKRARDLETLLQQWGSQQLNSVHGCSVEALMSATPGYVIPPACPLAPQTEHDVVTQLPFMRPARLWNPEHSIWFRTGDGALMPYQPMSSRQNAMLTLVMGGMGYGKSNLISDHINFFGNHPQAEGMPYIRGMDFGASASGVVDIIRSSLPAERKHEAIFEPFTNDGSLVKNLLDTRLGCMYPLEDQMTFLVNWLATLIDDVVGVYSGMNTITALLTDALKIAYRRKDFRVPGAEPALYHPGLADPLVVRKLEQVGLEIDPHTCWWEVAMALCEHGLAERDDEALHAAKVAQRRAVPQLYDVIAACDSLGEQYRNATPVGGIPLVSAVCNSLRAANGLFKCFNGITNRDISESRICVFDMTTVFGRGDGAAAEWMRAVYFMTAFRLLTEDLFVSKRETGEEMMLTRGRLGISEGMLNWHLSYLESQDQLIKVFWCDELHRIGKVAGAFKTLESMGFEGRKYRVGLMLGTQLPQHFPAPLVELCSSAFIFGASQSAENASLIAKIFDLSDDERKAIQGITKPNSEKGAEVFVVHKIDTRTQRIKLHFNLGALKRWAYATEANERALRSILYRDGRSTEWARKILAEHVPDLAREVKRRYDRREATGETGVSEIEIIHEIAADLLAMDSRRSLGKTS